MRHYILDDVAVLEPRGQLLGDTESAVLDEIFNVRIAMGIRKILIDLSAVTTTNSTGRGELVRMHVQAQTKGAQVVFCGLGPHLVHIFQMTRLDQALTLAADRAQGFALLHAHSTG